MALLAVLCHAGFSQASVFSQTGCTIPFLTAHLFLILDLFFGDHCAFCPTVVNSVDTSAPNVSLVWTDGVIHFVFIIIVLIGGNT